MKLLEKFRNAPLPFKASVAYLFVNILQKGLAFLTSPIYTRLLSTEEYGQVATFFSLVELIGIIAMFCLQGGIFNNGMVDYPNNRDEYSFSMLVLSNIITIITALLVVIGNDLFFKVTGLKHYQVVIMFVFFFLQPAFGFWTTRQRYEYKYKGVSLITIVLSVLAPISSILFIVLGNQNDKVYSRIFGYEIVLFACYIVFYFRIGYSSKWKINKSYWKPALAFNSVLIPHYLSTYILSSSDRIMIARLVDNATAGIYSLGYSIAAVVLALWVAINNSLIPYTYENCKKGNTEAIAKTTSIILALYGMLCAFAVLLTPEAIKVLAPSTYSGAVNVVPIVVSGVFFQALYNVFANIVYYYKKPKYVMIGSVVSALLNIALNFFLIPIWGYLAAAYTTLVCYMLQALLDFCAMKKVVGGNIYNMRFLIIESILILLLSVVSQYLYNNSVLRYVIIIMLLGVALFKKKKIGSLIKSMRDR